MKVMFDINVVLDVLQSRDPYHNDSATCLNRVVEGSIVGLFPAHGMTTVFYVLRRRGDLQVARTAVEWLLNTLVIVACDKDVLRRAMDLEMEDFEDAVVACVAELHDCEWIITRDLNDFARSPVPAISPHNFHPMLG